MKANNGARREISAVEAKFEAQRIAFAPLIFQAASSLLELGILEAVSKSGDAGLSQKEIAEKTGVSEYGVAVLCEAALGMNALKLAGERLLLAKTGWFLLEDELTRVNLNFVRDVCYEGAAFLSESVRDGKPLGLRVFGNEWRTIYEALGSLPEKVQKSWFEFDHFYSDIAFPQALEIVFSCGPKEPRRILDIGGNTAKWAIACCKYNNDVKVTVADLPGQTERAAENAARSGYGERISVFPCDALSDGPFPKDADTVWMSQFLDCFSLAQVTLILKKIAASTSADTNVFVLEPLWDKQRFEAASFSLRATSLYFTCMANGNSKMYGYAELTDAIEQAGFVLKTAHHNLGSNVYSLLHFKKK
jgi:hypothetical protein